MPALYPRPEDEFIYVERESVDVRCPNCGSKNIKKYPVLKARGWAVTTKCQDCWHELSLEYPRPFGPFEPLTKDLKFTPTG